MSLALNRIRKLEDEIKKIPDLKTKIIELENENRKLKTSSSQTAVSMEMQLVPKRRYDSSQKMSAEDTIEQTSASTQTKINDVTAASTATLMTSQTSQTTILTADVGIGVSPSQHNCATNTSETMVKPHRDVNTQTLMTSLVNRATNTYAPRTVDASTSMSRIVVERGTMTSSVMTSCRLTQTRAEETNFLRKPVMMTSLQTRSFDTLPKKSFEDLEENSRSKSSNNLQVIPKKSIMKKPGKALSQGGKSLKFATEINNASSIRSSFSDTFGSTQRPLTIPVCDVISSVDELHGTANEARKLEEENRRCEEDQKFYFYPELIESLSILEKEDATNNDILRAKNLVQQEWFEVAGQPGSSPIFIQSFLDQLTSHKLREKVINLTDENGNTVLHYTLSHGKIENTKLLLEVDELNVDLGNEAGYTPSMLAALCQIRSDLQLQVFHQLFMKADVNIQSVEAQQTALMLAACHGQLKSCKLLLECGADINASDEEGSTALMCAAEIGDVEIVKLLLSNPNCDPKLADQDGCTALSIAMNGGHKEAALQIYASVHLNKNKSSSTVLLMPQRAHSKQYASRK